MRLDVGKIIVRHLQSFFRVFLVCFGNRVSDRLTFAQPPNYLPVILHFLRRALADNPG